MIGQYLSKYKWKCYNIYFAKKNHLNKAHNYHKRFAGVAR